MRNLKLIIENYLFEEEESPPIEDESAAPEEEESAAPEEEESAEGDDQKNKDEEHAKNITADIAMTVSKEGTSAAVDELKISLKNRNPDFEVDISTIPELVTMFGKKKVKKVDLDNLEELPSHRTSRSKETLEKRGDLPGGFD